MQNKYVLKDLPSILQLISDCRTTDCSSITTIETPSGEIYKDVRVRTTVPNITTGEDGTLQFKDVTIYLLPVNSVETFTLEIQVE